MSVTFQDLQDEDNPKNGRVFSDPETALSLLQQLRMIEPPCMCQLTGDNGFNRMIGVARDFGCVQHSSNGGLPPFLMAVPSGGPSDQGDMEFRVGDTPTPIDGRYRIAFDALRDVVIQFVATGERSTSVSWEELA